MELSAWQYFPSTAQMLEANACSLLHLAKAKYFVLPEDGVNGSTGGLLCSCSGTSQPTRSNQGGGQHNLEASVAGSAADKTRLKQLDDDSKIWDETRNGANKQHVGSADEQHTDIPESEEEDNESHFLFDEVMWADMEAIAPAIYAGDLSQYTSQATEGQPKSVANVGLKTPNTASTDPGPTNTSIPLHCQAGQGQVTQREQAPGSKNPQKRLPVKRHGDVPLNVTAKKPNIAKLCAANLIQKAEFRRSMIIMKDKWKAEELADRREARAKAAKDALKRERAQRKHEVRAGKLERDHQLTVVKTQTRTHVMTELIRTGMDDATIQEMLYIFDAHA